MREFFDMQGFPTIVVLGIDGVELDRQVGFGGDADMFVTTIEDWAENKNTLFSYLKSWTQDTTNVEWNYRIAMRYMERYQVDSAQRFWHNIVSFDPTDEAGYAKAAEFNMALYDARSKGKPDKLAALLESETDAERMQTGYFVLARYYEAQNDVPNAAKVYKAALEKMPDNVNLMNACAWFIYEQQASEHYEWGIGLAQRAVELESDASIWDTLAWLLHSDGQYDKAVDAMAMAAQLDPKAEYFKQTLQRMKVDLQKQRL